MTRLLFLISLIILQGCSEQKATTEIKKPLVVQLAEVHLTSVSKAYEFPATVSAVKSVDLKFEVSGRLIFEKLIEGSSVSKGQVLAKIDPAPFRRKVEESRIRHEDAIRDLKRIEEVFARNVASQRDLDNAKSKFSITKIALANAEQDLSYTTIKAPFDAIVGSRFIENNSYIRAGDNLANLQDRSQLYFTFDVPERIMTANSGNRNIEATAQIIGHKDQMFNIHYVEHKTTPDPITQTYQITFAIEGEVTNLFYPGSRALVKIKNKATTTNALLVPINALIGDKTSGFNVWRFDQKSNTVKQLNVNVAQLMGEYAVIEGGLNEGDKVVSAAVNQMREGLVVKEYKADY